MKWIARIGEREETVQIPAPGPTTRRDDESTSHEPRSVRVRVGDDDLDLDVGGGVATDETTIIHDGRQYEVSIQRLSKSRYEVSVNGRRHEVTVDDQLSFLTRKAEGARGGKGGMVTAYMPGKVVAVLVEEGAEVKAGEGVVVLEAMKMENEIQAEVDGVVAKIHVEASQPVEGGDPLFEVAAVEP